MWAEISAQGMARSLSSESDWEDVFVYLYSLRFFEMPAETRRGKEAFESMGCGACHAAGETGAGPGKPVRDWARVDDPVTLVYQMWNHASTMKEQFAARNQEWKRLNGRDFLDLTAYVQLIQRLPPNREVSLPDAARGREAFDENCRACHTGPLSLATRLRNKTWMDIGAGLWNHGALPQSLPALSAAEIREVIAYVWELQYLGPEGNVPRGQSDFENKGCVSCHRNPANGEPESPHRGKTFTALSMVALGWGPARDMHQQMQNKGTPWPHLSPDEVSDLVAYMNTFGR